MECKNIICWRDNKKVYCGSKKAKEIEKELRSIFCPFCEGKVDLLKKFDIWFVGTYYGDDRMSCEVYDEIQNNIKTLLEELHNR